MGNIKVVFCWGEFCEGLTSQKDHGRERKNRRRETTGVSRKKKPQTTREEKGTQKDKAHPIKPVSFRSTEV